MDYLINFLFPISKIALHYEDVQQLKGIKLICLNIARRAFHHYLNRDFQQFDPLVGENGCQIRVMMLHQIFRSGEINEERLRNLILKCERNRERILSSSDLIEPIEELIESEKFLILSHALTLIRDPREKNLKTREELLNQFSEDYPVKEGCLREISFQAKRILSEMSVRYVQKTESIADPILRKILLQVEDANGQGLKCTSFYFGMKCLIERLKKNRVPIVVKISETFRCIFQYDENFILQKIDDPKPILSEPAFVVSCKMEDEEKGLSFINSLKDDDVISLILAQAASHPQFAGHQKGQKIRIFEHSDIKPHLTKCQGESLDEISLNISKCLNSKMLRMANSACKPATLDQVILAHAEFAQQIEKGNQSKHIIQITHIFCQTIQQALLQKD